MKVKKVSFYLMVYCLSPFLGFLNEAEAVAKTTHLDSYTKITNPAEVTIVADEKDAPEKKASPKEVKKETIKHSSNDEDEDETSEEEDFEDDAFKEYSDPIAPLNKFIFGFNKVTDGLILKPLTLAYKNAVPSFMRTGVHNVLNNLKEPLNFFNGILQLEGGKAAHSLARFFLNTIFGLGGLFDVATDAGVQHEPNDFGITLAKWGFGEGFYIVLPLFGPSNLRDSIGKVTDLFMDPFNYYVYQTDRQYLNYIRFTATTIDTRLNLLTVTDTLDKSSDPYNSYRVTFTDNRRYITGEHKEFKGDQINDEELEEEDNNNEEE